MEKATRDYGHIISYFKSSRKRKRKICFVVFFFVIKIGVKEGKGSGESKHASEAVDVKYRII